jgi:hypothetical protein
MNWILSGRNHNRTNNLVSNNNQKPTLQVKKKSWNLWRTGKKHTHTHKWMNKFVMSKGRGITNLYCGRTNLDLSKCLKPCILKGPFKFALHFGRGNCWLLIQSCGPPLNIRSMSLANGLQGMYDPQTQGRPGEVGDVWGLCLSLCQLWKVSNGGWFCMQNGSRKLHSIDKSIVFSMGRYFYMQRRKEKLQVLYGCLP